MSFNIRILLKIVLLRLSNNRLASCFLIDVNFLLPHTTHFDNIIVPPFIAFETDGIILFVFSPHFKQ